MSRGLADNKPIFQQIKEKIEDQIVNGEIKEHEQIPSTNQLVQFYKINHLTVSKGINLMVDDGIIYKKRGVGMFVAEGARAKLLEGRKGAFADQYILPMLQEAEKLGMSDEELINLIEQRRGRGMNS
ncbi:MULTISPECIES: GntR family transcriptional regulator [unclassified Paenibacillus]|uniref:GntR family transcriptional regulator n=1 Tax=Paenibacillus provencensis TaxID=441151 RepID=A0ABW3PT02_9BACL|nr:MULTISPECIES: GntR family transcriptional regulator [unclassified Paenibacillus]MCM3126883.1 GntR family transcriptional regulator [Paenibacillus sp. MER 78]SFS57508.1 DNA-binding transcriptional regulator YhcF, GntR family [Paenibacillus sp. 453mf]